MIKRFISGTKAVILSKVFLSSIVLADNLVFPDIIEVSSTPYRHRVVNEIGLLKPLRSTEDGLLLLDTKFKHDNKQNTEANFALAYRRLFGGFIGSIYTYYDRKSTTNHLSVNQITLGAEILTENYDFRFNAYLPENKIKKLGPDNVTLATEGTKVFALKKKNNEEHALPGYDVEIGMPLFGIFPDLHKKLDTKLLIAKYRFHKNNVDTNDGVRLRLEQKLFRNLFDDSYSSLTLSTGLAKTQSKKTDLFVGLNFRMALFKTKNKKGYESSKLKIRMMNPIIRDIDIVTKFPNELKFEKQRLAIGSNKFKKQIGNMYFVGDEKKDAYLGDGTIEAPLSKKQLTEKMANNEITDKDVIIALMSNDNPTKAQYNQFLRELFSDIPEISLENWLIGDGAGLPLSKSFRNIIGMKEYMGNEDSIWGSTLLFQKIPCSNPKIFFGSNINKLKVRPLPCGLQESDGNDNGPGSGSNNKNDDDIYYILGSPQKFEQLRNYLDMPPTTVGSKKGKVRDHQDDVHVVIGSPINYKELKKGGYLKMQPVSDSNKKGDVKKYQDDIHILIGSPTSIKR